MKKEVSGGGGGGGWVKDGGKQRKVEPMALSLHANATDNFQGETSEKKLAGKTR